MAENVSGILHSRNKEAFDSIIKSFEEVGYNISYELLNAKNYNVPQDRQRVFIIGFRKDKKINFTFPKAEEKILSLEEAIADLKNNPLPYDPKNPDKFNHEYYTAGFSTIFMSRNRVRQWHEPSFTIQAGGRHAPIHPQAPSWN